MLRTPAAAPSEREDAPLVAISLRPLIRIVGLYRQVILVAVGAAAVLFVLVAGYAFLRAPVERTATVAFTPLFEGAREGRYPNGESFTTADVVATPVLASVFEANDLGRYASLGAFGTRFFVAEFSNEAEALMAEFGSKLADRNLTAVDRARLEQDFTAKLASVPLQYVLTLVSPPRGWALSPTLMTKVLHDTLETWAKQAVELRGVTIYQRSLVTTAVFAPEDRTDPNLVRRIDKLREKVLRLSENVLGLESLPSAQTVRLKSPDLSLGELRTNLVHLIAYEIDPLFGAIRRSGIVENREETINYLADRLESVKRTIEERAGRRAALEASLRTYLQDGADRRPAPTSGGTSTGPTVTLDQTFLDELMVLTRRAEDAEFRQSLVERMTGEATAIVTLQMQERYYETILADFRAGRVAAGESTRQDLLKMIDGVYGKALVAFSHARQLYDTIAQHNLNPRGSLYSLTGPFTFRTDRSLPLTRLAWFGGLTLLAALVLATAGCFAHYYGYALRRHAA